jgi:hypothetical protein
VILLPWPRLSVVTDMEIPTVRKAVLGMMAMHRLQDGPSANSKTESARMKEELAEYKREAEDVSPLANPAL